jgi:hypothetical protein
MKKTPKLPYVIVRCTQAGVHAGELVSRKGQEVELRNARRLWYWTGAASLSELAVYGSKTPSTCKFAALVPKHEILDACEIIHTQPAGEKMIREQPEWRA